MCCRAARTPANSQLYLSTDVCALAEQINNHQRMLGDGEKAQVILFAFARFGSRFVSYQRRWHPSTFSTVYDRAAYNFCWAVIGDCDWFIIFFFKYLNEFLLFRRLHFLRYAQISVCIWALAEYALFCSCKPWNIAREIDVFHIIQMGWNVSVWVCSYLAIRWFETGQQLSDIGRLVIANIYLHNQPALSAWKSTTMNIDTIIYTGSKAK